MNQDTLKNGSVKFYHANGNIASEGFMKAGKPEGYWKTYHENGLLKSEGNRVNYQLDGVWKFYNESGLKTVEYEYREGKKNGYKRVYDPTTGYLVSEEPFSSDVRNGMAFYYKEDYKFKEVPFTNGKEEGEGKEITKEGLIQTITKYKNGFIQKEEKINRSDKFNRKQGVWKEFYPSGVVKKEMRYKDDKLDGYYKEFFPDGNLDKAEKYVDGVLQKNVAELVRLDVLNTYYESGKVKISGTFNKGVPEGIRRYYDENGTIVSGENYKDGVLIEKGIYDASGYRQGKWKEFYPNGSIRAEGEYKDDKRIGEWVFYHLNGSIEQKGKYTKDGKPTDTWKWFYDHGQLLREETFLRGLPEGEMIEYNDSGKVITRGSYLDGAKEGKWFQEDGDEREEGEYRGGEKEGEWIIRYVFNGKTASEGTYITGLENGKWKYYHFNGRIKAEGKYLMGEKDDTWKYFDTEGLLLTTILFENGKEVKIDGARLPYNESIEDK